MNGVKVAEPGKTSEDLLVSVTELASHKTLLESIVTALKDQIKSLQAQRGTEEQILLSLRDQKDRDYKVHQEALAKERAAYTAQLNVEKEEFRKRVAAFSQSEFDLTQKHRDLQGLEEKAQAISQATSQLRSQQIAVEKARIDAAQVLESAEQKQHAADQAMVFATQQIDQAKALAEKSQLAIQESDVRFQQAVTIETRNKELVDRLEALRTELDPKIQRVTELESSMADQKKQAEALHREAMQKQVENQQFQEQLAGLSDQLKQREQAIADKESNLRQYDLELKAKESLLSLKEMPVTP